MKSRQLTLALTKPMITTSGGSRVRSHAKKARPFAAGRPLHVVLRAKYGQPSLLRYERKIRTFINALGHKLGVRVDDYANAGNHLHLLVVPQSRVALSGFLRALAGTVARMMLGAAKGKKRGGYWLGRVFTRLMEWGRDFRCVKRYIRINRVETNAELTRDQARRITRRIEALEDELRQGAIAGLRVAGFCET